MSGSDSGQELTVELVLRDSEVAWNRFVALVDSVPLNLQEKPGVCGDWSLKTVVGHVAFWDGFEANRLARPGEFDEVDFQPLNDQNALDSAKKTFAELRAELEINHERAVAGINSNPTVSPAYIRELLYDHYVEHGLEIERWLAQT
jgi:hypothetical protein